MITMRNIKSLYVEYEEVIKAFGEKDIKSCFNRFVTAMDSFIITLGMTESLSVNDDALTFCIMDYFSDIMRLKDFHQIYHTNTVKCVSYESKWILRRKPIQVLSDNPSDPTTIYANEKFVLSHLTHELLKFNDDVILTDKAFEEYKAFIDTLHYYLKFRDYDAQAFEIMILAFKSGISYGSCK